MTTLRRTATACPVERAVHAIGGRWKSMIVWHLLAGPARYATLRRGLAGCGERVLVRQLRELEEEGIIARVALDAGARRVEYRLTAVGEGLGPVFAAMRAWGERLLSEEASAHRAGAA